MFADIPKACGKRNAGGPGKAKPRGLHEEVRDKSCLHLALSARTRHSALLAYGHSRPNDRNRTAQTTVLAFLTQYLGGEMVPLNAGRVMENPGRGISAHAPLARNDAEMGQRQASPG